MPVEDRLAGLPAVGGPGRDPRRPGVGLSDDAPVWRHQVHEDGVVARDGRRGSPLEDNGDWRLEVGSWRLEVGGWRLEVGGWRLEVGNWRFADLLICDLRCVTCNLRFDI